MKKFIFLFSFAAFAAVGAAISKDAIWAIRNYYTALNNFRPTYSEERFDLIGSSLHNKDLHTKVGKFFPGALRIGNSNQTLLAWAAYHYLDQEFLYNTQTNECVKPEHARCNIKHFVYLIYFCGGLSPDECVELLKAFYVGGFEEDVNEFKERFKYFFSDRVEGFLVEFPYLFVTNYLIFDPQARETIRKLAQDSDLFQAVEQVKNLQTPEGIQNSFKAFEQFLEKVKQCDTPVSDQSITELQQRFPLFETDHINRAINGFRSNSEQQNKIGHFIYQLSCQMPNLNYISLLEHFGKQEDYKAYSKEFEEAVIGMKVFNDFKLFEKYPCLHGYFYWARSDNDKNLFVSRLNETGSVETTFQELVKTQSSPFASQLSGGGSTSMFDSRIIVGAAIAGLLGVAAYNYKNLKHFFSKHFNKNKSEQTVDETETTKQSLVNPEPFI